MTLTSQRPPQGSAALHFLRDEVLSLPDDKLAAYLDGLTALERQMVERALARPILEPHQRAPAGSWRRWLLQAGRGAGKSLACADWFDCHMTGPPCDPRIPGGHQALIVAPTQGDATLSCVEGPSGLKVLNPDVYSITTKGGTHVFWPNGARALLLGAHSPDDVERFRSAGNRCAVWAEELAAWRLAEKAWEIMDFGLRTTTEAEPLVVASTTPKARPIIKEWRNDPKVVVTRASMLDNPHLNPVRRAELLEKYGGTRFGRQELEGEYIEDAEGALWHSDNLAEHHLAVAPRLDALCVGVDPPGSTAECGIVVVGGWVEIDGVHIGVIGDFSVAPPKGGKNLPEVWGPAIDRVFQASGAAVVVFEKNNGWEMGLSILRQVNPALPVQDVVASKGKVTRAEPFSLMADQGRFHLIGEPMPKLEDCMTSWEPGDTSPDRLDGMVWGAAWVLEKLSKVRNKGLEVSPGGVTSPSYWRSPR